MALFQRFHANGQNMNVLLKSRDSSHFSLTLSLHARTLSSHGKSPTLTISSDSACFTGLPPPPPSFLSLSSFLSQKWHCQILKHLSPLALVLRFLCVYLFLFWEDHTEGWHAWGSSVLGGLKAWKTRGDRIGLQSAQELMRVDGAKPVSWRPWEEKRKPG